mmetsp:Transcript_29083/g.95542  ORF Transcript_29083/g.95542 Transcript_29083/m.95542 type:complete len:256 (+) Transcript_29083:459-1226(+)
MVPGARRCGLCLRRRCRERDCARATLRLVAVGALSLAGRARRARLLRPSQAGHAHRRRRHDRRDSSVRRPEERARPPVRQREGRPLHTRAAARCGRRRPRRAEPLLRRRDEAQRRSHTHPLRRLPRQPPHQERGLLLPRQRLSARGKGDLLRLLRLHLRRRPQRDPRGLLAARRPAHLRAERRAHLLRFLHPPPHLRLGPRPRLHLEEHHKHLPSLPRAPPQRVPPLPALSDTGLRARQPGRAARTRRPRRLQAA